MAVGVPAVNRRERRRLETYNEIVAVSRALLREGNDLSLRSVANKMGITPPALYRYIDSVDQLHVMIARAICTDVVDAMTTARDRYGPDDPPARLAASATMLRCWALANRAEFQMAFANPTLMGAGRPLGDKASGMLPDVYDDDATNPFAAYFAGLFVELHLRGLIVVPTREDLDPALYEIIQKSSSDPGNPFAAALGVDGLGTLWLFKLAWVRLYGILMVEVFGQVEGELIGSDAVFNTLMRETFSSLGLADSWDRLIQVSRDTAAFASA